MQDDEFLCPIMLRPPDSKNTATVVINHCNVLLRYNLQQLIAVVGDCTNEGKAMHGVLYCQRGPSVVPLVQVLSDVFLYKYKLVSINLG